MAIRTVIATTQGKSPKVSVSAAPVAGIDAIQAGSLATLTTDVAAAQAVGAGDAHAEIDAIDVDVVALTAALNAVETGVTGDVIISVNNATVTRDQLRLAFDAAFKYLVDSSGFVS